MDQVALDYVEHAFPQIVPWVTGAIAVTAVLATQIPPPPATPATIAQKAWYWTYRSVNFVAINFGHARNATDPSNTKETSHA